MEDNNIVQDVEWTEKCPCCKKEITFKITKDCNRNFRAYITKNNGCKHFAEEEINQARYRMICNMLKELYENPDLLYARQKRSEEWKKMRLLGIDPTKFL